MTKEKGDVSDETVVDAAGWYARQVAQMVGRDLPIVNIQHHYLVTGPIPEFVERDQEIPVIRDPRASSYLRQEQKSGLIGIYEQADLAAAWAPNGFPSGASAIELFPDHRKCLMRWLGCGLERSALFAAARACRVTVPSASA